MLSAFQFYPDLDLCRVLLHHALALVMMILLLYRTGDLLLCTHVALPEEVFAPCMLV